MGFWAAWCRPDKFSTSSHTHTLTSMFFRDILLNQNLSLATSTFKTRHFLETGSRDVYWRLSKIVLFCSRHSLLKLDKFLNWLVWLFWILKHTLPWKLKSNFILTSVSFISQFFLFFISIQYAGKRNWFQVCIWQSLRCFSFPINLAYFCSIFLLLHSSLIFSRDLVEKREKGLKPYPDSSCSSNEDVNWKYLYIN